MNPEGYKEPQGPFWVELYTGTPANYGWDLWAEVDEWEEAKREAEQVVAHKYEYRIKNVEGQEFKL